MEKEMKATSTKGLGTEDSKLQGDASRSLDPLLLNQDGFQLGASAWGLYALRQSLVGSWLLASEPVVVGDERGKLYWAWECPQFVTVRDPSPLMGHSEGSVGEGRELRRKESSISQNKHLSGKRKDRPQG